MPAPSSERSRLGVSDWNVVTPETLRSVVEAVCDVIIVVDAYGNVLATVVDVAVKYGAVTDDVALMTPVLNVPFTVSPPSMRASPRTQR